MDDPKQHSLSYRYMRMGILYALIPHIYPSVGYCVVYFQSGPSTTFIRINGISSTLSFCLPLIIFGSSGDLLCTMKEYDSDFLFSASVEELKSVFYQKQVSIKMSCGNIINGKVKNLVMTAPVPKYEKETLVCGFDLDKVVLFDQIISIEVLN